MGSGERMEAGQELDAVVAEQVMGFRRAGQPKDCDGNFGGEPVLMPPGTSWTSLAREGFQPSPRGQLALTYFVPVYSTSLDAAFDVLANLAARGWKWDVQNRCGDFACHVHFPMHVANGRSVFERGKTVPLAICRAALSAVSLSLSTPREHTSDG